MAEKDSAQEKTEQPTPKKLLDAKKKGQVPRSKDFNSMAIMVFGAVGLLMMGGSIIDALKKIIVRALSPTRIELMDAITGPNLLKQSIIDALTAISPFLLLMLLVALLSPLSVGGWAFSVEAIAPKFSRMDPLAGFKRMFGLKGLMELIKAIGKVFVVAFVAIVFLSGLSDSFLNLGREPLIPAVTHAANLFGWAFLAMSCALIVIAAIDLPFQLWDHNQKLKMTFQEIKDEMKETEGRPEVKSRIRQLQYDMAQGRMMENVPEADVIVTNPSHYSVALKYDQENMSAPLVVAKGADLVAFRIREVANAHDIPFFEAPPLARALYAHTEIDDEVPTELYMAVAQVLAFVMQVRVAEKEGWDKPERPDPEIPKDWDPDPPKNDE